MQDTLQKEPRLNNSDQVQSFVLPEDVEEEARIAHIDFYRRSYLKLFFYYFMSIITLGLVALGAKWKLNLRILFKYSKANPRNAEFLIIQSEDTTKDHVPVQVKTLQLETSPKQYRVFSYRLYTYYFDTDDNIFRPIQFLIKDKTYKQIHEEFGQGILSNAQYEQRVTTYGDNSTNIPMKTNVKILVDEILSPFYIFQVFSIILWFTENYVVYAIVILFISITSILMSFFTIKRNYVKLRERSYFEATVQVFRTTDGDPQNLKPVTISSIFLVPGDIIEIPDDQVMPCDIILLKGTCIMNESMLTGESVPVIKHQLPSSQKIFDAHADSAYILFSGTKCLETKKTGREGPAAVGVVLTTGFATMKGRLIRSLLYSKPESFKFYRDSIKYIGAMACIALICFLFSLRAFIEQGASVFMILKKSLDIFTIAVPPALATCLSIGSEIASNRLEKKGVITKSQTKINVAGRVDVMCFDKTGTLTEDSLDLYGVKPVGEISDNEIRFLKTVKRDFSHNMNKVNDGSQKKQKALSHMMLELMATCHSLTHVRGVLSGDPLDLKMFSATEWEMQDPQATSPDHTSKLCTVRPSLETARPDGYYDENSKVFVIKRFDFSSKLQRMSVVVKDPKENKQRIYVKGSPEMLKELCKQETLPETFSYALSQYAQNGLRVIACGTRELEEDVKPLDNLEREDFEKDLNFLGFMVFENRLKPATNGIIKKLNDADIKTVMLTGDNPLTAIFIARSCGILEGDKKVMLAVLKTSDEDSSIKNLEWQYIEPSKIDDKAEDAGPKKTENDEETLVLDILPIKLNENAENNGDKTVENSESATLEKVYQDNSVAIAMTGEALSFLKVSNSDPVLYRTALRKAKVFARMRPEEKALVVEEFQKQDHTVGMCGDGANDCPALKAANVGVSLSEAEASIAAPFLSKITDITCIDIVLREGRAALTTSFQCFKYMSMYSFIQTLSVVSLYSRKSSLTDESFLFIDLFLILPLAITMSYTTARKKLSKTKPSGSLLSPPVVSSVVGQLIIQAFFQVLLISTLTNKEWYVDSKALHPGDDDINHLNVSYDSTALFLMANFQYIATVLAFSVGKPFRKAFYTNIKFVLTLVFAVVSSVFIVFTTSGTIMDVMELLSLPTDFRWTILSYAIVNSIVTLAYEQFIVGCLTPKLNEAKKRRRYIQN